MDIIVNLYSHNLLLLTPINKIYDNIFNKLTLIKIKKTSSSFNNDNYYKQSNFLVNNQVKILNNKLNFKLSSFKGEILNTYNLSCLLYTSDAADE